MARGVSYSQGHGTKKVAACFVPNGRRTRAKRPLALGGT
jgi:hypothetical protein